MRVVVTGPTGNCGTRLVRALAAEPAVDAVLGIARRLPELDVPGIEWAAADVEHDDLVPLLRAAGAVVAPEGTIAADVLALAEPAGALPVHASVETAHAALGAG